MARRALVTGIGGQDGSYLAELLLGHGYEVFGVTPTSPEGLQDGIELLPVDLADAGTVAAAIRDVKPDETYHLASLSFVPASWEDPVGTRRVRSVLRGRAPGRTAARASDRDGF